MNITKTWIEAPLTSGIVLLATGLMATSVAVADEEDALIRPSGMDDTAALQAALDSCSRKPGLDTHEDCEIQLAKGHFYTNTLVATNFHGEISGAGQRKTVIHPVADVHLRITTDDPFFANDPTVENPYPYLLTFAEGEIEISDLSFGFPDGDLDAGPWYLYCWANYGALAGAITVTGRNPVEFEIEDVSIAGGMSPYGPNVFTAVYYQGLLLREGAPTPDCGNPLVDVVNLSGKFKAEENDVHNVYTGLAAAGLENAKVKLEDNNVSAFFSGVDISDVLDAEAEISGNSIGVDDSLGFGVIGISVLQNYFGYPYGNSEFVIEENDIFVDSPLNPDSAAIFYWNLADIFDRSIRIEDNSSNMGPDGILVFGDNGIAVIE